MSLQVNTITIYIDGKPCETAGGQSLLRACLSLGFDVPYFCWHPALESVGACRQCAVKIFQDDKDTRGRIVMSCMTPVADQMRVSVDDPEAKRFRAANIEWLMLNHPHDCPVCDEGGECHLQDMTVMTGHIYRRTRFDKRTYRNQDLGPFINHEMNRCIQCYRCTRFYRDYAGGRDFEVLGSRDHVYFGRHREGPLESVFSGNLVEICPTGVFTDKTAKTHFTRVWDLATAPSICVHCGIGCNTIPGERYGEVRRIRNRYNGEVNGYFLCDRGRFGYEFVNDSRRVRAPLVRAREDDSLKPVGRAQALAHVRDIILGSHGLVGIGSPRASLESNFALRTLVGPERFFGGMARTESDLVALVIDVLTGGPAHTPSLGGTASCDAAFVLGEDITNTAPMIALAVLQALKNKDKAAAGKLNIPPWDDRAVREAAQPGRGPLFVATPSDTWLDSMATGVVRGAPDDMARLGFAVAHRIDPHSPDVKGLDEALSARAGAIAEMLKQAERPLVVSGVSCGSRKVIEGAANVARALAKTGQNVEISFVAPECNSLGLGLMANHGIDAALTEVEEGRADTMIILENDLFRRVDETRLTRCLGRARHVIVLDHLLHKTASLADIVLPAATFAESSGTLVNNEGRAQRFYQVNVPEGTVRASWKWIGDLMAGTGRSDGRWETLDECTTSLATAFPVFRPVLHIAPSASFRITGRKIPRQSHRVSGRTSISANLHIHEPGPQDDHDSPFAFSMEGYEGRPPAPLIPRFWAPAWNSVHAVNKYQVKVGGPLHGGDPGKRLIEPGGTEEMGYFAHPPEPFGRAASFLALPLFHTFGSEELSMCGPAVASRAPRPYVALNPEDADRLEVREGEEVEVWFSGRPHRVCVLVKSELPVGTAGLPKGLPGFVWVDDNEYIEIRRAAL